MGVSGRFYSRSFCDGRLGLGAPSSDGVGALVVREEEEDVGLGGLLCFLLRRGGGLDGIALHLDVVLLRRTGRAAAGGDELPLAWLDQLAVGGRLVAPSSQPGGRGQVLVVVDRDEAGCVRSEHEAVHFVPLRSGIA